MERCQEKRYILKNKTYKSNKIQILSGKSVTVLDAKKKFIILDDKSQIHFRKLLLATGGLARHLDILGSNLKNVFYLRTIEDGEAVKEAMQTAKNVVVIGGGFIGCELASSFTKKGIKTTIIEVGSKISTREHILTPFAKVKGRHITYP
jgi:NADPH-dependent 2,4-dienoyl-CoA reductase/sulfur reductase-like enzyme